MTSINKKGRDNYAIYVIEIFWHDCRYAYHIQRTKIFEYKESMAVRGCCSSVFDCSYDNLVLCYGATAQVSYDGGSTWDTSPTVELPDFYSYEEFAGWIETESDNLQALVAAGELTQKEAAAAIAQYQSALSGIEDGVQVGKRSSYEEDQIFFSMPNNPQSEVFQTVLYDGNSYRNFGPYNTKAELYAALEQYTNDQTKSGNMTEVEANSILDKYR